MSGLQSDSITEKRKTIETIHQVLKSLAIPYGFARIRNKKKRQNIKDRIVQIKCPLYVFTITEKNATKYLLTNLRLLQPFREVKKFLLSDSLKRINLTSISSSLSGIG